MANITSQGLENRRQTENKTGIRIEKELGLCEEIIMNE